ncbi:MULTISPECIES: ROK family protein [Pseudonocardia]|uniref:ROK family protein n=2 Tax=Pseudonocardia TaxID=1847 RepID=F4CQV3_PSEUX|nr:ROK family protein [Pseudonocardia dioxanivorans]AEA23353.1 ROK family protein [Pseudonocardia dioxanivorans CB1190]
MTRPQTPLPGGPPLAAPGAAGPVPAGPAAPEPAGPATVRRHNRGLVLGAVADAAASRAAIAARTGLTRGTVSSLVDDLLADGMLVELEAPRGGRGRPANPLQLNPSGPGGVGLEIGVDDVAACVADLTGAVRVARRVPSDHRHRDPAHGLARAAGLVAEVVAESGLTIAEVRVALPGVVTPAGVLQRAPNLPRWQDVGVAELLRAALHRDVPVTAANEADLAALAELWSGRGLRDMLFVSGGVGVGAGVLLDGRLFRGAGGRAGELGHVVVDPAGRSCTCGGTGCLETVAGVAALLRAANVSDVDSLVRGPGPALDVAGSALGVALAGAVNLLDVPAVVLGGVYARLGDALVERVAAALRSRVLVRPPVRVLSAALGRDAALQGAALGVVRDLVGS